MTDIAVKMTGITKRFFGVLANDHIDFSVRVNEIHALLGENGAGKSTLMSILSGSCRPDEGRIEIYGKEVRIPNPNAARALNIGMVHQHFKLVHNYTVTENITLGMEPAGRFGLLDMKKAERKVEELSALYDLYVNPRSKIEDISVGMQQRAEILKTLYRNADIIIFDEPTAVLTPKETDELLDIIRRLRAEGKTIIIITHKLREIKAIADRCTVLRQGRVIKTVNVAETGEDRFAEMMVGRVVRFDIEKAPPRTGEVRLSIKNISVKNSRGNMAVSNLSLDVRAGEVMGIAGVDGNGQSELVFALTGALRLESGSITIYGDRRGTGAPVPRNISRLSVRKRIEAGLGNVPEDRQKYGLVGEFSLAENLILKNYYRAPWTRRGFFLDYAAINRRAAELIAGYDIRAGGGALSPAENMSGGNQQKLIIAREISLSPGVLIIAQPTRGLDVGAIEFIRKRIIAVRDSGQAVLLISFELDEIMSLCDRIAAISKGTIAGILEAGEVSATEIGLMMAGAARGGK